MADENLIFQIYNEDGTSFNNLALKKSTYTSIVMSLNDKIEGDIFHVNNSLAFTFKEYIIHNGVKYSLKIDNPPTIVRKGMNEDNGDLKGMTKYSLTFYHPMAQLYSIPFTDVAVSNDETKYKSEDTTFYWIGTLTAICAKINKCLQGTLWTCSLQTGFIDDGIQSDVIQFTNQMISDVLKTAYDTWKVPYVIDGYKILFGKPSNEIYVDEGKTTPYIFKMGQGLGLKNNDRTPKNNTIITRLAGNGSEDNIPSGYPKIKWEGDHSWSYTIDNDSTKENSFPIIDGMINGESVKLINHPFTRNVLSPSIYCDSVFNRISPYLAFGISNPFYNKDIELKDYYDARPFIRFHINHEATTDGSIKLNLNGTDYSIPVTSGFKVSYRLKVIKGATTDGRIYISIGDGVQFIDTDTMQTIYLSIISFGTNFINDGTITISIGSNNYNIKITKEKLETKSIAQIIVDSLTLLDISKEGYYANYVAQEMGISVLYISKLDYTTIPNISLNVGNTGITYTINQNISTQTNTCYSPTSMAAYLATQTFLGFSNSYKSGDDYVTLTSTRTFTNISDPVFVDYGSGSNIIFEQYDILPVIDKNIIEICSYILPSEFKFSFTRKNQSFDIINVENNIFTAELNPNGTGITSTKDNIVIFNNYINKNLPSYYKKGFDGSDETVTTVKPSIVGAKYNNQEIDIIKNIQWINDDGTPANDIDDTLNSTTSKYTQGYFKIDLYPLGFDVYAMASITSSMTVNMTNGACNGCKFELGVNWDNVKSNFYHTKDDDTLIFDPTNIYSNHRDYTRYPDSTNNSISIIVKKDTSTFGTLMPNIYQQPKIGDTFVFLGIDMPQIFIDNKQVELDSVMNQYMKENNIAYYEYPLDIDEYFITNNKYILNQIGPNAIFKFEYAEDVLALSIKEYSITYGEKALPTYKITLTDDISIVLNAIGEVTEGLSKLGSQVVALQGLFGKDILSLLDNYISSTNDDTANGIITFLKDIIVKGKASVGADLTVGGKSSVGGDSNVGGNNNISGNNNINGNQTIKEDISSSNYNSDTQSGFKLGKKDANHYKLSITDLEIWGKAIFNSLEVRRLVSVGGNYMFSPANGTILTVQEFETYYRCYLLADDGTTATENGFNVNDNVLCETFNIKEGVYENVSNKRYWRTIVSVSNASEILYDKGLVYWGQVDADHLVYDSDGNPITYISESPLYEGKKFYYIDLSKTLCEAGSDIPSAGDEIATFGNTTDVDRQNSIYITSVGDDAPAIKLYAGISGFSIEEKDYVSFGVDKEKNKAFLKVYGEEYIGSRDLSTYLRFTQENGVEIKGKLSEGTKLEDGTEVNSLPANIQNLATTVDGFHSGVFNIIRNSGFTGDYQNLELDTDTALNTDTDLYNNKLVCWDNSNAVVSTDTYTQSGYSCSISSGYISQSLYYQQISNESYVMSIKAKGASMTIEVGGKTFNQVLTSEFSIYNFKYKSNGGTIFRIAGTCVVSEVELAVGTVPLSWSQSPLDNHKMFDRFQAIKYVTDAMADGSVQFSGGLALMTMIMLGNYQDGQMLNVTSGLSGIYNNDDDVSFWSGGTFEQAIAAVQMFKNDPTHQPSEAELTSIAKAVITHGGKIIMNDAVIRGYIYALGGIFKDIKLSGSIRNPFENSTGNFNLDVNDNVIVLGNGNEDSIEANYTLPWTTENNGRKITIANYKYLTGISTGSLVINAPENKYFFMNGQNLTSINISKFGFVELLGIGDSSNFFGWLVLHKKYFKGIGTTMAAYAFGSVTVVQGKNNIEAVMSCWAYDDRNLELERIDVGRYKITVQNDWSDYFVVLTGVKGLYSGAPYVNACIVDQQATYFEVNTHDDASLNDGSFNFVIYPSSLTFNHV